MSEPILAIRNGKSSRAFSLTPQDLLEDRSLSSDAKVVISWMIGRPKNWIFRIGHLRESLGIHSDSKWRRIRNELTEKGFLSIKRHVKNGEIAWDVRVNLGDYDMRRFDDKAQRAVPAVDPAPVVVETVSESAEIAESVAIVKDPVSAAADPAPAVETEAETLAVSMLPVPAVESVEIESEIPDLPAPAPAPAARGKRRAAPALPVEIAEAIKPSQQFLAAKLFESLCEQRLDGSVGEKLDARGRAYAAQIVGEADSPIALLKHLSKVGVRVGRLPELAMPGETIVQAKARLAHREPKQPTYCPAAQESAAKKIDLAAFLESDSNGHDAAPAPAPAAPAPDGAALIKSCPDEYMRWLKSASFATLKMIEDVGGVLAALEKFGPKTLLADEFAQARVALAQTPPQRSAPSSKSGFKGFRDFAASLKRA